MTGMKNMGTELIRLFLNEDVLTITDETYATFYIDLMENVDRYVGKKSKPSGDGY